MWLLRNEAKGLIFRVKPGKSNIVTRKEGDLLLIGDQSISRKHAELLVNNENARGGIILRDLGSKYGTFTALGGGELTQVSPNQELTLNDGDSVRFGIQWNLWRVEYFPLVVATSTLNSEEKAEVKEVVAALGGEVMNDWQPCCTYLSMNKLTVTVKVVCALACGKPIVVPGYWKALKDSLASIQTNLPDYKDFLPPIAEALLNPTKVSFTPNPERATLFSGYTFVAASSKQLTRIKPMVTAASGTAVVFSSISFPDSKLTHEKTVLMQHNPGDKQGSQQSQVANGYIPAARKVKAAGLRCVPEAEIGLSIIYCSMAQHCNPRFRAQSLFSTGSTENTQQITIICPDTEESAKSLQNAVATSSGTKKKRALEDPSEEGLHPSKKQNSEDLFNTQPDEDHENNNSNIQTKPSSNYGLRNKKSIVNPSVDMFAPSGQSCLSKNTLNKAAPNSPELSPKAKKPVVKASLDMFAPSGSGRENRNQTNPSCQDMFASNESQQIQGTNSKRNISVVQDRKRSLLQDEEEDVFSFSTNKNCNNIQKSKIEKDDEFSFAPTKKSMKQTVVDDVNDEFTFGPPKINNQSKVVEKDDELSFSTRNPTKKRCRQSNPDIFDSSMESKKSDSRVRVSNTKSCNFGSDEESGDVFAFSGGPATKRKRENGSTLNYLDEPDGEVVLGILCKEENTSVEPQSASEPIVSEDRTENATEKKDLIVYSKTRQTPLKIKEEMKDGSIDDLTKKLHGTTIVVTRPLLVVRKKPPQEQPESGVKNFKTFRKVAGLNKRSVPHIIGGSDLIPHRSICKNVKEIMLPSPKHEDEDEDDDFVFPGEKKINN